MTNHRVISLKTFLSIGYEISLPNSGLLLRSKRNLALTILFC